MYFTLADRPREARCSAECRENWARLDLLLNPVASLRKGRDLELADVSEDLPLSTKRKERDIDIGRVVKEDTALFTLGTKRRITFDD
jgi:hypothetical protein